MEAGARLVLGLESQPPRVHMRLEGNGVDVVWLQLRALYGDGEVKSNRRLTVEVDSFLALTEPLATVCRRYRVRFAPDQGVRSLLGDLHDLSRELDEAYRGSIAVAEQELEGRLRKDGSSGD